MNNTSYTIHSRRPARLTTKPVSGTFTRRYGNTEFDWNNVVDTAKVGISGVFGLFNDKNLTTRNNNDNFTRQQLSDDETKRTRAIILGLVAIVLVVGAVVVMTKKK